MSYLVDTNVIGELMRRRPDAEVLRWAERVTRHALSVVTVDEIAYGLSRKSVPGLRDWFAGYIEAHEVLPITRDIAFRAGELRGDLARRGAIRTQANMLIAATAQIHALTVVTRNTRDFEGCGVGVLNPFAWGDPA